MGNDAPTQAVILVGGLGSRLGALTSSRPKPLLPVNGKPFLDLLLWHLARFGFERVLLLAGHCAEAVEQYAVSANSEFSLDIRVLTEPHPLGTAGALLFAGSLLDERFLLLNGDSIYDFNWLDLHRLASLDPRCLVAMSLRRLADASRFGVVNVEGEQITGFHPQGTSNGGLVNGGVYLINRKILELLPAAGSLELEILPLLASSGRLFGREYDGFFLDIGIPQAYSSAQTSVWESQNRPAIMFDRDGVLNVDYGYVGQVSRFEWLGDAIEAIKLANDLGYFVFVITNQAGIARGLYTEQEMHTLHSHMQCELRKRGAHIDAFRFCPHHPAGIIPSLTTKCRCRKPQSGMIVDILTRWAVEKTRTLLIGDKSSDVEAAESAGISSRLFTGGSLRRVVQDFSPAPAAK
jgi:D,D-heptose 1,7-bisphosphate phosphatase